MNTNDRNLLNKNLAGDFSRPTYDCDPKSGAFCDDDKVVRSSFGEYRDPKGGECHNDKNTDFYSHTGFHTDEFKDILGDKDGSYKL